MHVKKLKRHVCTCNAGILYTFYGTIVTEKELFSGWKIRGMGCGNGWKRVKQDEVKKTNNQVHIKSDSKKFTF